MGLQKDSKGGSGFGAVAVQVDSNSAFCYLKDSEYVAQLAKDKNVNIKSLQIPGCKGFEIEGQFSAVLKAEEDFKRTVANIESASVILTGGRKSAADTDEDILEIKTKTQERFDVFVKVVEKKSVKDSLKHIADIGLKTEKEIIKDDKPGSVSWCFPGGYRISLCKRPLNDAPAIVHVYFTGWNGKTSSLIFCHGKTKQLHHEILDDGTGGYIVKVTAGLPKFRGMGNDTSDLRSLFAKILEKSGHDDHNSVSFSLEEIQNWSMVSFLECLLAATWEHFKSPNTDKPIFIELCHSREAEYQTVNYHCHALVKSLMENDIDCMKSQPLQIKVVVNKLNCIQAEVLVNTTSKDLRLDAGAVSMALLKTGGDGLQRDCKTYYPKGINWGEIAVTRGHNLLSKYVFHGAIPSYHLKLTEMEKLTAFRCLMDACLTKAAELGCGTIAFPVLGAGNLRYPVDLVAAEMFTCVAKFKVNHQRSSLRTVSFVVYPADQETLRASFSYILVI